MIRIKLSSFFPFVNFLSSGQHVQNLQNWTKERERKRPSLMHVLFLLIHRLNLNKQRIVQPVVVLSCVLSFSLPLSLRTIQDSHWEESGYFINDSVILVLENPPPLLLVFHASRDCKCMSCFFISVSFLLFWRRTIFCVTRLISCNLSLSLSSYPASKFERQSLIGSIDSLWREKEDQETDEWWEKREEGKHRTEKYQAEKYQTEKRAAYKPRYKADARDEAERRQVDNTQSKASKEKKKVKRKEQGKRRETTLEKKCLCQHQAFVFRILVVSVLRRHV